MDRNPNSPRDPRQSRDARGSREPRGGSPDPGPRSPQGTRPPVAPPRASSASTVVVKSGVPHGATESGWLPDCVYTGEKFESGLAFFADAVGRITRFSREAADIAAARRLDGQAALPGLVNAHSHAFHRTLRGRAEQR